MPRSELTQSLLIDSDALEDLADTFPTLNEGYLKKEDLKEALGKLGYHLAGFELRDLEKELPGQGDQISVETFMMLHAIVKEKKDLGRQFKPTQVLAEKAELKSYESEKVTASQAKHTVSSAEEHGFADWINRSLKNDTQCTSHLPILDGELYEKCKNGILLCKLINKSIPDTIDERTLNIGPKLSVFKENENLVLAINSAESIGCCVVNIGPQDIAQGTKHLLLGLIWQIIRIGLLGQVNLTHHAELVALLRPGETLDDLRQLSPEEILIRWVNYHLEKAGVSRRINNFKDDIMDSEVYGNLIQQITPREKQDCMMPVNAVLQPTDNMQRAQRVLKNAENLDAAAFVTAEDIAKANERGKNRERLNLAFVANLFNNYPALDVPEDVEVAIEETLEEKTYRNWMNSMGVTPYVNDLYSDLRNGLVLLQLFDVLQPGIVDWNKIVRVFNPKKKIFQMQDNCAYVVEYAKQIKLKVVNLSGEDLREGEKKLILGLCFQMMRAYTIKLLSKLRGDGKPIEDKDIVNWTNEKLSGAGKTSKISGFRDQSIASAIPVIDLVDTIQPGSVDYQLVTKERESDAKFAITMARKIGARVYALPQHLTEVNQKMVMTVFACLMVLDYQHAAASSQQ